MYKIVLVAGARPNFMKIAPIMREIDIRKDFEAVLVHTGQHYDDNMSETFFSGLGIRRPDYFLSVGSGSHAVQTANIMVEFERVCITEKPDMVVVVGDVNSTVAAGLVAKKLDITLAHVEAGLRSRDRRMPEEINRLATDSISDLFYVTEPDGVVNLQKEGQSLDKVHFVGHVMIDNLFFQLNKINDEEVVSKSIRDFKQKLPATYICMTLHRPSNVDSKEELSLLLSSIAEIASSIPVVFPCHPRTKSRILEFGLEGFVKLFDQNNFAVDQGILLLAPLGYDDFLYLWRDSVLVLTDSGGLQEETTALRIPCLTLRENTERPITVDVGSNQLVGRDMEKMKREIQKILTGNNSKGQIPDLWDGSASVRIVDSFLSFLENMN